VRLAGNPLPRSSTGAAPSALGRLQVEVVSSARR